MAWETAEASADDEVTLQRGGETGLDKGAGVWLIELG